MRRWRGVAFAIPLTLAVSACGSLDPLDPFFDTEPLEPERVSMDEGGAQAAPGLDDVPLEPARRPSRQADRQELERSLGEDSAEAMGEPGEGGGEPSNPPGAPALDVPEEPDLPEMPDLSNGGPPRSQGSQEGMLPSRTVTLASNGEASANEGAGNEAVSVFNVEDALASAGRARRRQGEPLAVIHFGHGSRSLDARDRAVLQRVVSRYRAEQGGRLHVVGHSSSRTQAMDPIAHSEANLDVSLSRAENVAEALASLGVSRQHIRVEGRGNSDQVYHEFMETGEAGNRRAEIYLERR